MSARKRPEKPDDPVEAMLASNKRELAINLAVGGMSWTDIAAQLGVDQKTLWRWRQEPRFLATIRRIQKDARDAAAAKIQSEVTKSIDTLVQLRDNTKVPFSVRRQCACDLLEVAGVLGKRAEGIAPAEQDAPVIDREALVQWLAEAAAREPEPETAP
jgi:hypothetical protein